MSDIPPPQLTPTPPAIPQQQQQQVQSPQPNLSTSFIPPPPPLPSMTNEYIPPPPQPPPPPSQAPGTPLATGITSEFTATPIGRRQRSASYVGTDIVQQQQFSQQQQSQEGASPATPSGSKTIPKPPPSAKFHPQHRVYKTLYFTGSRGASPDVSQQQQQQFGSSAPRYPALQVRRMSTDIPPPSQQGGMSALSVGSSYTASPGVSSQSHTPSTGTSGSCASPAIMDIPPPPANSELDSDEAKRDEFGNVRTTRLRRPSVSAVAPGDMNYIPPPPAPPPPPPAGFQMRGGEQMSPLTAYASQAPTLSAAILAATNPVAMSPGMQQQQQQSRGRNYSAMDEMGGKWSGYDEEYAKQREHIKKELQIPEGPEFTMGEVRREVRKVRDVVEVQEMSYASRNVYAEYTRNFTVCRPGDSAKHGVAMNTFGALSAVKKYEPPPSISFAPFRIRDPAGNAGNDSTTVLRTPRRATIPDGNSANSAAGAAAAVVTGVMVPGDQLSEERVTEMIREYTQPKVRLEVIMRGSSYTQSSYDPLFFSIALYDTVQRTRVSEDFCFQLNDRQTVQSLGLGSLIGSERPITRAAFGVNGASSSLYFVVKAFRIFHGEIEKDQAAILKSKTDPATHREDLKKVAAAYTQVGALPLQPYYWAAAPVYTATGHSRTSVDYGSSPNLSLNSPSPAVPSNSSTPSIPFHLLSPFSTPSSSSPALQAASGSGSGGGGGAAQGGNLQLVTSHRLESFMMVKSALTDSVIFEHLCGEKSRRNKGACGVTLSFDVVESKSTDETTTRISESQIPIIPFDPSKEFVKEIHSFSQSVVPHFECVNDLYIYPKRLTIKMPSPHSGVQISVQVLSESSLRAGAAVGRTKYVYPALYSWNSTNESGEATDTPPALLGEAFSTIQADASHPEFGDELKMQLPSHLGDLCLLFTVYSVSFSGGKLSRAQVGHAGISLSEVGSGGGAVRHAGEYYLPVVKVLGELTPRMMSPMEKAAAKKSKSFLHIKLVPWTSIFPESASMANFLEAASVPDIAAGDQNRLRDSLVGLANVENVAEMLFFLPMMRAFFRVISCCDLGMALNAYRHLVTFLFTVFSTPGYQGKESNSPLLGLYAAVFFDPELFSEGGRPLHEGLVRAFQDMLKASRSKTFQEHPQDSPFTWFLLELITKSIAAYVCAGKTLSEDFQWGVLDLVAGLLRLYKGTSMIHTKVSLRALGMFINNLFPLIGDRGRLINMVMGYLSSTDPENKDSITFNTLKLPLVQALADYEHLVPINRPMEFDPALFENVANLTSAFTLNHPFVSEIIHEVCTAISMPTNRHTAIKTFRDLVRKHSADERYRAPELQADIALMYFPAVLNLMEHRAEIAALCAPSKQQGQGQQQQGQQGQQQRLVGQTTSALVASPQQQAQQQQQQHELLTAYMWIVKTCPAEAFRAWWRHDTEKRHIMFFDMLRFCLECFRGQDQLDSSIAAVARLCTDFSEDNAAALAAPGSPVFRCIYDCLTTALSLARDRSVKVAVDTFRTLLERIPQQFFSHSGNAYIDGLCTEVFRAVGEGRYNGTFIKPKDAAEFLFSMFQKNYDLTGDTFRMRTQAVLAISRLFVESTSTSTCMSTSTSAPKGSQSPAASAGSSGCGGTESASTDRYEMVEGAIDFDTLLSIVHAVQSKCVPGETVAAVTEAIEEVVSKASFLLECQRKIQRTTDPDALAEYYYQNTVSSAQNPDFRIIWLENLCVKHKSAGNFEEAAHCKIFVALLIAKYLITTYHANLSEDDFALLTPNVASVLAQIDIRAAQDSGQFQTSAWTIDALILSLRRASECLAKAQLYEHCLEVYSVVTNILRKEKRYDDLSEVLREYTKTCDLIAKKEKERESMMISRFYRARFFGAALEEELNGKQFIYKRPPSVQLADMQTHLRNFLVEKVAGDQTRVVLLPNRPVDESALEHDKVYFQLASVEPYFDSAELEKRNTSYERTFGARRFIAVQAYTEDGKKSQANDLAEQKEKKTIYDAEVAFPFVKSRIEIVAHKEIILEPIQHALELIIGRCDKIKEQLENSPPKINPLQQVLQGSVVPMVNEGPVKICEVFLSEDAIKSNPPQDVENLSIAMGNFVELCAAAIQLNRTLITASQKKFSEMIEKYYKEMYDKISGYLEKTLDYEPKETYSQEDLDRKLWREQKKVITDY